LGKRLLSCPGSTTGPRGGADSTLLIPCPNPYRNIVVPPCSGYRDPSCPSLLYPATVTTGLTRSWSIGMRLCRFSLDDLVLTGFYADDHVIPIDQAAEAYC